MGPQPFEGTLNTHRVYIRYIRIPGLRAPTRGPWVHPKNKGSIKGLGSRVSEKRGYLILGSLY